MNPTSVTRDTWHPQTRLDREAVLLELRQILASPHFCNSKRYPALLQYVVEKTLDGEADSLKERTLGVEVFDRPPSYDTNADTVVRYTAGEVRKRLSLYYHELPRKTSIQISLPAGSYVPEFAATADAVEEPPPLQLPVAPLPEAATPLPSGPQIPPPSVSTASASSLHRRVVFALIGLFAVCASIGSWVWKSHSSALTTPVSSFWAPVIRDQSAVLMCTGGSVFAQNHLSGVTTASKDSAYPFVSMQSASAIAQLSGLIEVSGLSTHLQASATTPLSDLRERSTILLGGYNNQWTLRLLQPLRFHFSPEDGTLASIVDSTQPKVAWSRDQSLPYSSADDYALVARFHDTVTDSWIVALAGLGRNGTEAAALFVTSPRYMELLKEQLGSDLSNRNVEVVLKVNVIDGKTGAPTIVATHVW